LKLTDRAAYDRYHSEFLGLFAQFKGTLVAADEHPEVVEAETDVDKVVLMSFPDRADYRRISVNRHAGRRYRRAPHRRITGLHLQVSWGTTASVN
jgi:uncharacterized protein (DUF1330 family)